VIFNKDTRKYKPYAFTEHGILMLSRGEPSPFHGSVEVQV